MVRDHMNVKDLLFFWILRLQGHWRSRTSRSILYQKPCTQVRPSTCDASLSPSSLPTIYFSLQLPLHWFDICCRACNLGSFSALSIPIFLPLSLRSTISLYPCLICLWLNSNPLLHAYKQIEVQLRQSFCVHLETSALAWMHELGTWKLNWKQWLFKPVVGV